MEPERRSHHRRDRWSLTPWDGDANRTDCFLHRHAVPVDPPGETDPDVAAFVDDLLAGLTEREREVVELVYMEGIPQTTVAEMLGVSENVVNQRALRARRKMVDAGGDRVAELYSQPSRPTPALPQTYPPQGMAGNQ
jgi:DNA-directed RNA polymerase specialized sigma24 family protein